MAGLIHRACCAALLLLLAACSSLSLDTAARLRSIDYLNDDIASLVLAFDLPQGLEPIPGGSSLGFDATTPAAGERHIKAMLVEADAEDAAAALPPPADGRTYYLFGFSDADQTRLREAQAWARTLQPGAAALAVNLAPGFCSSGALDMDKARVSVLLALPGAVGLAPLVSNESLRTLLAAAPVKDVPACAGHSG